MKRIISITIALCLVFCSVLPVYAEAWSNTQADTVTRTVTGILTAILNNGIAFTNWATLYADGTAPAYPGSFQNLYKRIDWALSWIVPDTMHTSSDPTIMDSLIVLTTYAMNHLPDISAIAGYVGNWMSANNTHLNNLEKALTTYYLSTGNLDITARRQNAHESLVGQNATYPILSVRESLDGTISNGSYRWDRGSPLGNIALIGQTISNNQANIYRARWVADLTHYNDNLTTWDSQGSTLTQIAFTPESAIQGLYRYLAFTQRDVARLAYVFANDEELEARELAQANQEQVLDDFIDPNGTGAVSSTDLGSMADASGSFKDNFDTGQSASGIWNVFDRDYDWFSQTTADNLQPSLTRGAEEYSTPYLDEYYKELDSILEVNKRD